MITTIFTIKTPNGKSFFDDTDLVAKFVSIIEAKSSHPGLVFSGINVDGNLIRRLDVLEENTFFSEEIKVLSESFRESLILAGYDFVFMTGSTMLDVPNVVSIFGSFKKLDFENGKLVTPLI